MVQWLHLITLYFIILNNPNIITFRYKPVALFERLSFCVIQQLRSPEPSFKPQELANVAWAFTSVQSSVSLKQQLFDHIAAHAIVLLNDSSSTPVFKYMELSSLSLSFARIRMRHPVLFDSMAAYIVRKASSPSNAQPLTAHVSNGQQLETNTATTGTPYLQRVGDLNIQVVKDLARAYGQNKHIHDGLLHVLARYSAENFTHIPPKFIIWLAQSFSRFASPGLVQRLSNGIPTEPAEASHSRSEKDSHPGESSDGLRLFCEQVLSRAYRERLMECEGSDSTVAEVTSMLCALVNLRLFATHKDNSPDNQGSSVFLEEVGLASPYCYIV